MSGLIAAGGSDWSYGGSILTAALPMILFIAVSAALWVMYTKPHLVPGHRYQHIQTRSAVGTAPVTPPAQPGTTGTGPATAGTGQPGPGTGEDLR